jgi:hypothetical protein
LAFTEGRLLGYDQTGRIVLSYRDSADGKLKSEALDPSHFQIASYSASVPFVCSLEIFGKGVNPLVPTTRKISRQQATLTP